MANEAKTHAAAAAGTNDPLVRTLLEALRGVSQELKTSAELSEGARKAIEKYKRIDSELAVGRLARELKDIISSPGPLGQR
jgi:hypothetical protein